MDEILNKFRSIKTVTLSSFEDFVNENGVCPIIEKLTSKILTDSKYAEMIANQSYVHQNGFYKIVLYFEDTGYSLRLHIWDKLNSTVDSHIHNHKGRLLSYIITGSLAITLYDIKEEGEPYYCYELNHDPKIYKFKFLNKVSLIKYSTIKVCNKCCYELEHDRLHDIQNASGNISATLVHFDHYATLKTKVLSEKEINSNRNIPKRLEVKELKEVLMKLKKHLNAGV